VRSLPSAVLRRASSSAGCKFAHVARLLVEDQRAVAYAANLFDEVAYPLEHLAQFAVAALDEDDFIPGIVALADLAYAGGRGADRERTRLTTLDGHRRAQNVQFALAGLAGDLYEIGFLHAGRALVRQLASSPSLVTSSRPSLMVVQAAYGIEALAHLVEKLHDRGRPSGSRTVVTKPLGLLRTK